MTTATAPQPTTDTSTRYQPGEALPNGAIVTLTESGPGGEYVMARWDRHDGLVRWVTWFVAASGATVDGHYFEYRGGEHEPIADAFADFRRRVAGRGGSRK